MPTLKVYYNCDKSPSRMARLITINVTDEYLTMRPEKFRLFLKQKTRELENYYPLHEGVRVFLSFQSKIK